MEHARLCQGLEVSRRDSQWLQSYFGSESVASGRQTSADVWVTANSAAAAEVLARQKMLIGAFGAQRKALVDALKPDLLSFGTSSEYSVAAPKLKRTRELIQAFEWHHWPVRSDASVEQNLVTLRRIHGQLEMLDHAWQAEQRGAELVDFLTVQQRLPAGSRSPYAHPLIVTANFKAAAEQREAAAKGRADALAALRQLTARLE
jgi:hypothetical protein